MQFGTVLSLVNIYIDLPNLGTPLDWEPEALEKAFDIIFAKARNIGHIGEIKAFTDCKALSYELRKRLLAKGIYVVDTPPLNNNGKSSDDQAMFLALAQLPFLYQNVKTAVIVAGDGDYTLAVASLNQHGIETVLMSTNGTSFALEKAANGCTYIDISPDTQADDSPKKSKNLKRVSEWDDATLLQRIRELINQHEGDLDCKSLTAELVRDETDKAVVKQVADRVEELFKRKIIIPYFANSDGVRKPHIRLNKKLMEELGYSSVPKRN